MQTKTAIVTGASSGIGLGIAQALLRQGYNVVATSRHASQTRQLEASARLSFVDGDVGEASTAERAVAAARGFGGPDLLVNNAGIFLAKPFTDYTAEDYAQLLSTNLAGFFHMTQQSLRLMAPVKRGHVVNIGTSLASQPGAHAGKWS